MSYFLWTHISIIPCMLDISYYYLDNQTLLPPMATFIASLSVTTIIFKILPNELTMCYDLKAYTLNFSIHVYSIYKEKIYEHFKGMWQSSDCWKGNHSIQVIFCAVILMKQATLQLIENSKKRSIWKLSGKHIRDIWRNGVVIGGL